MWLDNGMTNTTNTAATITAQVGTLTYTINLHRFFENDLGRFYEIITPRGKSATLRLDSKGALKAIGAGSLDRMNALALAKTLGHHIPGAIAI